MSKKRLATESSNDGQATEDLDLFQPEDKTKRARLVAVNATALQDLPIVLLERILAEVVAMEVNGMKLAKSVRKDKADLVISRLRTVSSQWSNILASTSFKTKLCGVLDDIADETIRLEMLHRSVIHSFILKVTAAKDEIFILCGLHDFNAKTSESSVSFEIRVYDREELGKVKCVIALPRISVNDIAACSVSDCLYVTNEDTKSILRITRDEEKHTFSIQTWIGDLGRLIYAMNVSDSGNLMIISGPAEQDRAESVRVYSPNGFLQHDVKLSPYIVGLAEVKVVMQKSNGNLLLQSVSEQSKTVITEINYTDGTIERQYESSLGGESGVSFADASGRIVINDPENGIQLLDSELNPLEFTGPQPNKDDVHLFYYLHYISERNEVVSVCALDPVNSVITLFRFTEE